MSSSTAALTLCLGARRCLSYSPAARAALLNIRGLKRRQTTRFSGGLNPTKPRLAGYGPQRNVLAFGQAFGGRPPEGAPVRAAGLVQGGGGGGSARLIRGRVPASLLQGRPRARGANGANGHRRANGANGHGANGHGANGRLKANGHRANGGHRVSESPAYASDPAGEDQDRDGEGARRKFDSDLVVVLDMDECLIHSQFLSHQRSSSAPAAASPPPEDKYRQAESRPAGSPAFNTDEEAERIISSNCEYFRVQLPDGDLVHVNKRPNLDDFLSTICSRYETHVFTAAMEVYASPLLDRLDPGGDMFGRRFFRESCTLDSDLGVYVKDLGAALGGRSPWGIGSSSVTEPVPLVNGEADRAAALAESYGEGRVVLVDNNPLSFLAQPSNGILVSNFYDDPKDATLEAVAELLEELDGAGDVRPVLDRRFGLAEALGDVVKFSSGGGWR